MRFSEAFNWKIYIINALSEADCGRIFDFWVKKKGKAFPLEAWSGPEGSRS